MEQPRPQPTAAPAQAAAAPGPARKGRPRSTDADHAILAATRAVLAELGWGGLTMSAVAARAAVAKTTLYRRWASKSELVVAAVAVLFDDLEMTDRGSLRADIEATVRQFAVLLALPETQAALMAVFAEASRDPALRRLVRHAIIDPQKELVRRGREAAQRRGELPPDASAACALSDIDMIFDAVAGAVEHRILVSGEPATPAWISRFTSLLLNPLADLPAAP